MKWARWASEVTIFLGALDRWRSILSFEVHLTAGNVSLPIQGGHHGVTCLLPGRQSLLLNQPLTAKRRPDFVHQTSLGLNHCDDVGSDF